MGSQGGDKLMHALWHGAGLVTAGVIATPISDSDVGEGEGLIAVWRDDELLNALGRMKDVDSVPVPFDASADRQLVELLLACRVGFEPFHGNVRAMIWTSDLRRSVENTHRDRGGSERVGSCASWAGAESPRATPRFLLLAGHAETKRGSPRRGCSPSDRRNVQIVKLTTVWRLGRWGG